MIAAMLVGAMLMAGPDAGTRSGSEMFDQVVDASKKEITKKVQEKKAPPFAAAVLKAGNELATLFSTKLGVETKVKSVLLSPREGAEGAQAGFDMAIVTFTNEKETFALAFIGQGDKLQILPRDFKEL